MADGCLGKCRSSTISQPPSNNKSQPICRWSAPVRKKPDDGAHAKRKTERTIGQPIARSIFQPGRRNFRDYAHDVRMGDDGTSSPSPRMGGARVTYVKPELRNRNGWHRRPACAVRPLAGRKRPDAGAENRRAKKFNRFSRSERRVAARHRPVACATQRIGRRHYGVRVKCIIPENSVIRIIPDYFAAALMSSNSFCTSGGGGRSRKARAIYSARR